jgi:hypothetical protein
MAYSRCFQVRLVVGSNRDRLDRKSSRARAQDEARELSTSGQARNTLESRDGSSLELVSLTAGPSSSAATETIYLALHKQHRYARHLPLPMAMVTTHHGLPLPSTSVAASSLPFPPLRRLPRRYAAFPARAARGRLRRLGFPGASLYGRNGQGYGFSLRFIKGIFFF